MPKRIVIQVRVKNDKRRRNALKIATGCRGVQSVALEGESRDQIVITGDGVDPVCLTNQMRKKFGRATLISVVDIKEGDDAGGEEKKKEENYLVPYCCGNNLPPCPAYYVVYDPYPNSCGIL